jgi:hypothetical protein
MDSNDSVLVPLAGSCEHDSHLPVSIEDRKWKPAERLSTTQRDPYPYS